MNRISCILITVAIATLFSCKKKEDTTQAPASTTGNVTNTITVNTNTFNATTTEMVSFSFGSVIVNTTNTLTASSNCSTGSYSLTSAAPLRKIHFETNLYKNNSQYFRIKNRGYVSNTVGYYLTLQDLKNAYSIGNHSYSDNYANDGFALYVFNPDGSMWSSENGENSFNQTNSSTVNFNIIDTVGYNYQATYPRLKVKANFNCWMYYLSSGSPVDSFYVSNGSAIFSVCN
ncbi:MAG: hypothetical protein H7141_09250 [Burkholderiales bacterium]|nr:hypothetical protein [Bacteroidia bacterium]